LCNNFSNIRGRHYSPNTVNNVYINH
jgi:hypothetical protein